MLQKHERLTYDSKSAFKFNTCLGNNIMSARKGEKKIFTGLRKQFKQHLLERRTFNRRERK